MEKLIKKTSKLACVLALAAFVTLGLSGLALADAPAPDTYKAAKVKRGINYPAYLYAKGQRWESGYKKYVQPAKGYDFSVLPLASHNYVPGTWE